MKNREKYAEEILDIVCNGGTVAVNNDGKLINCDNIPCSQCTFFKTRDKCTNELIRWCEAEYIETPR